MAEWDAGEDLNHLRRDRGGSPTHFASDISIYRRSAISPISGLIADIRAYRRYHGYIADYHGYIADYHGYIADHHGSIYDITAIFSINRDMPETIAIFSINHDIPEAIAIFSIFLG